MTDSRTALVTGADQPLSRALVQGLAARMRPADQVLANGRDAERVFDATESVASGARSRSRVEGWILDVADVDSVFERAHELRTRYGALDVVISGAVGAPEPRDSEIDHADDFIDITNIATHAMLRAFAPVLRPGSCFAVVVGAPGHLSPRLQNLFDGASLEQVEYAVESWRSALHLRTAREAGWPARLAIPATVAQVAAVRAVAAERRARDTADGTLIMAVWPDATRVSASQDPHSERPPWNARGSRGSRTRPGPGRVCLPGPLRRTGPVGGGRALVRRRPTVRVEPVPEPLKQGLSPRTQCRAST
ncbi:MULTISPECIES: SDR family NAD(P)-dependent oxidoreductase [Streptomyces]|uniref:SDR family NAD(P)-dependent oxidoreductase n=1 Tax=Streptomyces TaxID=1883 RepID=UPI00298F3988|nr:MULTISPECIES: SDR family NAD(P)-dependent oxidoreductase [Streptomyces]MDW8471519.1 SDR family NAD(P)-dependent oxidoreductase [Streptomyces scabiei]